MQLNLLVQRRERRWHIANIIALAFLVLSALLSLSAGEIWFFPFFGDSPLQQQLLVELRLPRMIAAILIGASLAVSGGVLQVLLGNPLAEPVCWGFQAEPAWPWLSSCFFSRRWPALMD